MTYRPRHVLLLVPAALIALPGASCSTMNDRGSNAPTTPTGADARLSALDQLRTLAGRQRYTPGHAAPASSATPGVPVHRLTPLTDAQLTQGSDAQLDLPEVLDRLRLSAAADSARSTTAQPGPTHRQALRLYSEARLKRLDGRVAEALRDMEQALRLDPDHPDLLAAVGDLQHVLGRRTSAAQTLRRAVRAGADDPRLLWIVARDAARAGHESETAQLLARAWSEPLEQRDPALALLIGTDLGESLCELGYLRAGARSIIRALSIDPESLAGSRSTLDLPEQLRRRGELWMLAGDALLRLRDVENACTAYEQARGAANLDPSSALARLVHARCIGGQHAVAAILLLDDIRARGGAIDDLHAQLARHLSRPELVGALMGRCVDELSSVLASDAPNSTRRSLASLAAACASVEPGGSAYARETLLRACQSWGPDDTLLAQVLDSCATPAEQADSLCTLTERDPWLADACTRALAHHGVHTVQTISLLAKDGREAAHLLHASWLQRTGRHEDALRALDGASDRSASHKGSIALAARHACVLRELDRLNDSSASFPRLDASAPPRDLLSLAHAQSDAGDSRGVLDTLDPLLDAGSTAPAAYRIEASLLGAAHAARANQPERAEALLQTALTLDPRDQRVLEALLTLHQPDGPDPDAVKLTNTMRLLRQHAPGAPIIRQIVAIDLVQKGLYKQAEPQLMSLIDDRGQPPTTLALLLRVWEDAAKNDLERAEHAEAWLRERLSARPQSTTLALALSRVLVAMGKAQDADALLASFPGELQTPDMLRQREWVLREGLGLTSRADAMALARLEHAPRTLQTLLELVPIQLRAERPDDASRAIERASRLLDADSPTEHRRALTGLLLSLEPGQFTDASPEAVARLTSACDHAITLTPEAREPLTLAIVRLLCTAGDEDADSLASRVLNLQDTDRALAARAELEARRLLFAPEGQAGRGLRFLARLVLDDRQLDPARGLEWVIIAGGRAHDADLAWLLDRIDKPEQAEALIRSARERGLAIEEKFASLDEHKAEVAHVVASIATLNHRDQLAADAHRHALRLNPQHAWVANDHGYSILERGGDINEAARLIELAYTKLSDSTSVIDSLGWLRYKQGRLDDDPALADEVGGGLGAVSLLELAASTFDGRSNYEVLDHCADALWRQNKDAASRDRARVYWRNSAMLLRARIQELRARGDTHSPTLMQLQDTLATILAKIEASINGAAEPRISEVGIPPVFTPRPEPAPRPPDQSQLLELDDAVP